MVFSGWCNTVSMEGKVGRIVDTEPDGEFERVHCNKGVDGYNLVENLSL